MTKVDYPAAVLGAIAAAALWTVLVKNKRSTRLNGASTPRGTPPAPTTDHPVLPGSARPTEDPVLDVVPGEFPAECDVVDVATPTPIKSYW